MVKLIWKATGATIYAKDTVAERFLELGLAYAPADDFIATATIGELREYAEEHGIDLGEATKKADIVAVIKAAMGNG